jgi:hypothetical protein
MQLTFLSACRKGCNGSGIKPKLISKLSAANLVTQVDTIHLRVTCYGRIRVKQLERCAIKIKIKTLPVLEKVTGGCFQKLSRRSCRTRCKGTGMGPNEFRGVGVRWGVGWVKSTRGGVSMYRRFRKLASRLSQYLQKRTNHVILY